MTALHAHSSPWAPDEPLILVGLAAAGFAYERGAARLPGRPATRRVSFAAALTTLAAALLSPLDELAGDLFSAHMVQHLLLTLVAPPLLVHAKPGPALVASLPRRLRRGTSRPRRAARRIAGPLSRPVPLTAAYGIVLWGWHAPALYDAAVAFPAVHAAEHLSMLLAATGLWRLILAPRVHPFGRIAVTFATSLQSGVLGAALVFAPFPLYSAHLSTTGAYGLGALEDQQLAGALMWIPPSVVYLTVTGVLAARALRPAEVGGET